jgi:hypothetical protein
LVIDYADPGGGTFPVWYDMARWHGDLSSRPSLGQWILSFWHRALEAGRILEDILPLVVGLLVLGSMAQRRHSARPLERVALLLGLWGIAVCGVFMPVHVEFRYMAVGVFLVCLVLFHRAERLFDWSALQAAAQLVGVMMLIPLSAPLGRALEHAGESIVGRAEPDEHVAIARQLHVLGISPGDRIAVAGYAHEDYYAHIAGIQISAQVCDAETYGNVDWHDPQASCRAASLFRRGAGFLAPALDALRSNGVKALVTREAPVDALPPGWRRLGERFAVLIF